MMESVIRPQWTLPLIVTRRNKITAGALLWLFASAVYLTSNHFPIFEPQFLLMTPIDLAVPFIPNTLWIYISEYVFFVIIYLLCRDEENLNRYVYSFFALQTTSVLIFWLWPTTFPREAFPLPDDLNAATYFVFSNLRELDSPNNCFPSLHVSSVFLTSFIFLNEQKKKFPFFFCWAAAIAFSTLTTKQHYFVDVLGGLAMAIIFYALFHRMVAYRPFDWGGVQAKR